MKNYIFAFLFCLNAFACFGQLAIRHPMLKPQNPDSLDIAYYSGKKNYLHTTLQVFGLNMTVWAFDRYILKGDYAYISMRTVKDNFRKGFIWDNDNMGTNMFFHPYHGNLYFNSARSNGFNFWHSSLYSIGGSAMWELFMECEYPSTNDIIATPVGGMALGEVLYRASDLLLDDRKTGYERVGREVAAFIVSPMRGLTRFINGDYKQKRRTSGRQFGIPDISIDVSVGIRSMQLREEYDIGTGAAATVGIEYGDRFDAENMLPYDFFR